MSRQASGQHVTDEDVAQTMTDAEPIVTLAPPTLVESQSRGEIDTQIATARRFPRDVARFIKSVESLATLNVDIAEQCFYKLKRRGGGEDRSIEGPSVRFAEIVAACWGNIRIDARTIGEDDRFVTAQGVAWDIERNTAIRFEVRRRITTKNGTRYSDDMIATTSNAAAAIALRNAVFRVVPKAFWEPVLDKVKAVAVGDAKTLSERRQRALEYFTAKLGVPIDRICQYLGVEGVESITLRHLEDLSGLKTALKDGDTTLDAVFPPPAKTGSTDAEIDRLVADLPESARVSVTVGFDALSMLPAQRLAFLRKHTKADEVEAEIARLVQAQPPADHSNGEAAEA